MDGKPEPTREMVEFARGQTWTPSNGEPGRYIDQYRAASIADHPYRMGEAIVCWAKSDSEHGWCSASSFKRWIKRTGATIR